MTLRLGVPNKGRLNERTIELLRKSGLDLGEDIGRKLYVKVANQDLEVMFVRAQDIPGFIAAGAIDMGITGLDELAESGHELVNALNLEFGYCHLSVAVPEESGITDASQIKDGSRIATSFPNLTKRYFESMGKDVSVIVVTGAAEIMPYLGISDYIVDLVSTGSTLKMNRLREVGTIVESQAAVITSESALAEHSVKIQEIVDSIKSVIIAEEKKYLMANIPRDKLAEAEAIIPGMDGPTILEVAGNADFVAVHAVVDSDKVFHTINELKKIGARGILTTPIERLVN
ncbi:MAG: ATP phosphoribosyltransferase [Candidatus Methanomethylophilaceae archaeon]|nr:ATP phosphoribosyltransferase [Candidatus Methanomethylophilaceae archaeon]MBQ8643177.1 ATP phosphoribosyltransferase [Candidatus Methanomethylophilaceae archaeon]